MTPRVMVLAACALLAAVAGCGGGVEPTTPTSTAAPTAAPAADPAATGPRATILEVKGTPGETMRVVVVFENPTAAPCAIPTYTIHWPGGSKTIELDGFVVPPGESRQRSMKTHPDDGDITSLQAGTARVELPARCGAP